MASRLNEWKDQAANPAAPAGAQQAARAAAGYEQNPQGSQSKLGQWTSQAGYVNQAKSWYTGANQDGTENGWDNGFTDKFIKGQDRAAKEHRLGTYFESETATGVVTWDHTSTDGKTEFKFGDVYEDGKKVANLYDEKDGGFDKRTADLMMSPWLFDGKTKAEIFGASDHEERLSREVQSKREQNAIDIPKAMKALDFSKDVEEREKQMRDGFGDEAIVAGGAAGGAALGAGVGSLLPGAGTAVGAAGGALVGGVGAFLNKDQLTEAAARAYEITSMATEENGGLAGFAEGVHQWAGFGGKLLSPMSNLVQGAYDAKAGTVGDGESEFYKMDAEGKRQAPNWVKVADVGASVGDALLQFASPIGASLYTTQMTGTITGEVGGLVLSGGKSFDDRQGGFDNIFTDDKGHLDLGSAAAGIGAVGIDVVQLGMAKGLTQKADASMRAIGADALYSTGRLGKFSPKTVTEKLPTWAGGKSQEVKDVLRAGGREEELVGHKFLLDADGKVVSTRKSLGLLAPSEQLPALSAKNMARRAAAKDSGAVPADEFYKAALSMATGERKITNALVNGFGEGYEEAIQQVLEPMSHNSSANAGDIINSFVYGAAMGAGMTMGTNLHTSTADQKLFAQAAVQFKARTGGDLDKATWRGMTDINKRTMAVGSAIETQAMQAAYKKAVDDQATTLNAGVVGAAKLQDAVNTAMSQNLAKMTDRTDGAFVITQLEDAGRFNAKGEIEASDAYTMPSDGVGASAAQTFQNLYQRLRGFNVQRQSLEQDLKAAQLDGAQNPEDTDKVERVGVLTAQLEEVTQILSVGQTFLDEFQSEVERLYVPGVTQDAIEANIAVLNHGLRTLFNEGDSTYASTPEQKRALSRAISMLMARDPHDSSGSYQVLVPQISPHLTMAGADNVLQVSHAILPMLRGDFDGDKLRQLNQLVLSNDDYVSLRAGTQAVGAGSSVNVPAPKYEKYIVEQLSSSLASNNQTLRTFAEGMLIDISATIRNRYKDAITDTATLDRVLERFYNAVKTNTKDARAVLLDGLAKNFGGELSTFSRNNLSNEWLWIDQVVRSSMQQFQETYAMHRPDIGPLPDIGQTVSPNKQEESVRTVRQQRAATEGQTLGQLAAGDSLFRMFQKLHYTSGLAPVLSSSKPQDRKQLRDLAEFYEALGQDIVGSELDAIRSKDSITARVMASLNRLSADAATLDPNLSKNTAMAIIANMQVQDLEVDSEGHYKPESNGKIISVAQLLLKRSVMQDRREKDAIFAASPELQAKHARLLGMTRPGGRGQSNPVNAERAFVEIVGSQQLYALLGDDAYIFGPHLTVEQFIRTYANQSSTDRLRTAKNLKLEAPYLGKRRGKDMPYSLKDVRDDKITGYRAVVDAIIAVGNHRIALNEDGTLTGELAEKSDRVSKDFQQAHTKVRAALRDYLGLSARRDGELNEEVVQRLLESNPDFAKQVMALIPNAAANAVFEVRDNTVWISPWVYRMFTMENAEEAEMHYVRNLIEAQWNSLQNAVMEEDAVEGENGRKYSRLNRRMHRVWYRLATNDDNGLLFSQFYKEMRNATSVTEFYKWLNTTPGIRGEQAPLVPWVDDVAEFDPDKSQGGWTTQLAGSELREAIATLSTGADRLIKGISEERAAWLADQQTIMAIRRVVRKDAGEDVALEAGDRELHDQFEKTIQQAGEMVTSLGPQAMIYQTVGAVRGFYPQAHTKGKNPDNVEAQGSFDAQRDALDYVTNYERMMGALHSVNLDAVSANMSMLAKDDFRTMDDSGRTVEWSKPSVESMLDLLEDVDTRPMARSVLFPQVMERTTSGNLSNQLLVGKNLKSLLDGRTFGNLFPKNDRLSQDSALRYMSLLEAQARQHGSTNDVQRAVNDYVIAQTSAATTPLTQYDYEQMTVQAYHEVARIIQATASVAAWQETNGSDGLTPIRDAVRGAAKDLRKANLLGLKGDDAKSSDLIIDQMVKDREAEHREQVKELADLLAANTDPVSAATIEAELAAAERDMETFRTQIESLQNNDQVAAVVAMYSVPADPIAAVEMQKNLVEYITNHMGIVEQVSSQAIVFQKLTNQLMDPAKRGDIPTMTPAEWDVLSRSVIAHYLTEASGRAAYNMSVAPFPDADHSQDQRYYDTSFGYLIDPFFDASSPMMKAAIDLHRRANRHTIVATDKDIVDLITGTIFKDFKLGRWTPDVVRSSIEANQRLDSAAAAPAIAMAGNSPKRQAVISAATRRTFQKPGPELLSKSTVNLRMLSRGLTDSVSVELPGVGAVLRPLAQLNNRFAASAIATFPDGSTVDLLTTTDAGRSWQGDPTVRDSEYYEVHVDRLREAIVAEAIKRDVDPQTVSVDLSFFHPDSQPATPEFSNNVYFEGTSFLLDGDDQASLNATLWFANGGINPSTQAQALDASKLGVAAIQVIPTPTAADRRAMEDAWATDLSETLRLKTQQIMATDMGFGYLDPEFYNAVYKNVKLRHFVQGMRDGKRVLLSAEQVIEFQQANPDQPLPLEQASLWIPSDDVLRSLLGEIGNQGTATVYEDQLEYDLASVDTYRGVTPQMLERFRTASRSTLENTRVVNRAHQSQLVVRKMIDQAARDAYEIRMKFLRAERDEIHGERNKFVSKSGRGDNDFNTLDNLNRAVTAAEGYLRSENIAFDWTGAGIPWIGPRKPSDSALSKLMLRELSSAISSDNAARTGWIFREGDQSQPLEGILNEESLGNIRKGMRVAPDDLVVIELDSFNDDIELAKKRIDYFTQRGAYVVLGNSDGKGDMRNDLAVHLESNQYERVAGSAHIYKPADQGSRFQNVRARTSTLLATRGVSARNMLTIFNVSGKAIEENAAWVNEDNERLGAVKVTMNLVPTDAFAGYNVPVETTSGDTSQIEAVRQHLRGLDTVGGRRFLAEMSAETLTDPGAKTLAIKEFNEAFTRLMNRFDSNDGAVLPAPGDEFVKGDIIPLVGPTGEVLLYRHGYKAPKNREAVKEMQARTTPDSYNAKNIAVYSAKPEPAATIHDGTVVAFKPRAGYGLSVELNIPLQIFGDKKQLEWNGMKYVLTPRPASIQTPGHGIFEDRGIDLFASMDDAVSKESFEGMVNNHANAFAYFGIDFLPDIMDFFGTTDERLVRGALQQLQLEAPRLTVSAADALLHSQRITGSFSDETLQFASSMAQQQGLNADWMSKLDEDSVSAQIMRAITIYLMVPGTKVEDVLRSGGFNDTTSSVDAQSRLMPRLFTQIFDDSPLNSDLRIEMNKRFNQQIANQNTDGTGYRLHKDFTFEIRNADPSKNMRGFLQFAETHSSGDNPVVNGMSFDETERSGVSQHSANIAYQAVGATTPAQYDLSKARAFADGSTIHRYSEKDLQDGGLWRALTNVQPEKAFVPWRMDTPAEAAHRSLSREAMIHFRQPLDQNKDYGWTPQLKKDYLNAQQSITRVLGLKDNQVGIVDGWVRQFLGMPAGMNEDGEMHHVTGKQAVEAAELVKWNIERGYLPTVGAMVPLMDVHDLQALYHANKRSRSSWQPRLDMSDATRRAWQWDDWVKVSLGGALTADTLFDPLYLTALDGFMHTYQSASDSLLDLPVSMDALKAEDLLLPENNRAYVSSLDPNTQQLISEPAMLDSNAATIETLLGGKRIAGIYRGKMAPASEISKRLTKQKAWRAENGVPIPVDVTMKDFRKNGTEFVNHSTTTNALVRSLINLRVGTALINPALWISMGPEVMVRGMIDKSANLLTGQATTGILARGMASATASYKSRAQAREDALSSIIGDTNRTQAERDQAAADLEALPTASIWERLGFEARYTPEELKKLETLYDTLGQRSDFKGMIFRDLNFLRPHQSGIGRIEKGLEAYAKFGSRMQDPTYGVRATTLARRYVEAALEHIEARPTENPISVSTLTAELSRNPLFLQQRYPEAHDAASAAVAQARSLKQTPLAMMLRTMYEPMSESTNAFYNVSGSILLKLPLLFSGYAMNVVTTVTGLQGLSDMVAMSIDGRGKPGIFNRIGAHVRGIPRDQYDAKYGKTYDMSEVIEGIDLSRSFVRAGLTHTSLMAFGLLAGGLGLSGEDDETRRRRRAAELQGAGFVYDPRKMENDFRNADGLWFGHSVYQMPWIAKQFISPIIGIEKFLDTGDSRQIMWGFQDALGSFPIINTMMWRDAVETSQDFVAAANDSAKDGSKEGLMQSHNLLTSMVGTYERMLFENAFVNQLYQASDAYDRDPYAQPMLDSDETTQVDAAGQPRESQATRPYYFDDDNDPNTPDVIKEGFAGRSSTSAKLHSLTENRATLAGALSLFTGLGDSSFFRRNMVIKTRSYETPIATDEEAMAAVKSLVTAENGKAASSLNLKEAMTILRNQGVGGKYARNSELEPMAKDLMRQAGAAPLSVLDEAGRETLTKDGAKAVMRGLAKGSVKLGDPTLAGLHITYDQRNEIAKEWMQDLIQEGLDMGLDQTTATKRMQRLWQGPLDDPTIQGIGDILYTKEISYSDKLEYNQLNTTFVKGPDGLPWATGFGRSAVFGAVKFEKQIEPDKGMDGDYSGVMSIDGLSNSVDRANGQNLGARALVPVNDVSTVPTDKEIGDSIVKAMEDAAKQQYTPFEPFSSSGGSGSGGYGRRGGGGYGGGGGGSYAPTVYFSKMNPFPDQRAPYADGIPFINTSNPILRRSDVRRERISSERGRLKQWQ